MRWQELFADLEARARSLEQVDLELEIADRTRAEVGEIQLANRLRSALGATVRLQVQSVGLMEGRLEQVGRDWLLVTTPDDVVVALAAVGAVLDLSATAVSPAGLTAVAERSRTAPTAASATTTSSGVVTSSQSLPTCSSRPSISPTDCTCRRTVAPRAERSRLASWISPTSARVRLSLIHISEPTRRTPISY